MDNVDFVSGWDSLWGPIRSGGNGNLIVVASAIGVLLIIVAVLGFLWKKRKGGGGGAGASLGIPLTIGAILAGPNVVIPLLLRFAQFIVNIVIAVVNALL